MLGRRKACDNAISFMEFLLVQHRRALHLAIQAMRRLGVFNADPKGARMLLATTQD
jgi:hypothetical protein